MQPRRNDPAPLQPPGPNSTVRFPKSHQIAGRGPPQGRRLSPLPEPACRPCAPSGGLLRHRESKLTCYSAYAVAFSLNRLCDRSTQDILNAMRFAASCRGSLRRAVRFPPRAASRHRMLGTRPPRGAYVAHLARSLGVPIGRQVVLLPGRSRHLPHLFSSR
jgi:hypothetical protein